VARVGVVAALFGLWQLLTTDGAVRPTAFPTMSATVSSFVDQIHTAACWTLIGQTLEGWSVGVAIGGVGAIVLGSGIGLSRFAYRSTIPVIEFLKAVPVVAVLPLAIVEFGTRLPMKLTLVAFGVFFPLVIQVIYGVRSIDPTVSDTAASLQINGVRRFFVIVLPSAAPFIATGVRIAAATGLVLEIVSELIGGGAGLGLRILTAENAGPSSLSVMYAYVLITGLLGVTLTAIFTFGERRLLSWHESQRNIASRGA
jgi:ABC-type nitrate/sulfonate/bicarbonate transport system permease component